MNYPEIYAKILAAVRLINDISEYALVLVSEAMPRKKENDILPTPFIFPVFTSAGDFAYGAAPNLINAKLNWVVFVVGDRPQVDIAPHEINTLALKVAEILMNNFSYKFLFEVRVAEPDNFPTAFEGYAVRAVRFSTVVELGEKIEEPIITPITLKIARGNNYETAPIDEHEDLGGVAALAGDSQ